MLRAYQQDAVDAVISHFETSIDPICLSMATGAGKSHVLAALAHYYGRTLILAPSRELVDQDAQKYSLVSDDYSVFCASLGQKDLTGEAIFGSPQSVKNILGKMPRVEAVLIDECHRGIEEYNEIVIRLREMNPDLIVVGVSATPYKIGRGYLYRIDAAGRVLTDEECIKPYYAKCVYEISATELIKMGFLSEPVLVPTVEHYDTNSLVLSKGRYTADSVSEVFTGKATLTRRIVRDIIARSEDRRGVMVFAASVDHAYEIIELLPKRSARIITAETPAKLRAQYISAYRNGMYKYLVNVSTLTTGFDVPHVDHIAIMRATESASLFQQIVGRGLRICEGKDDVLISCYAGNIDRFFEDATDILSPVIRARKESTTGYLSVHCPACDYDNWFAALPNPNKLKTNRLGQFLDLAGSVIEVEGEPIPAHYGRRCANHQTINGRLSRCSHMWAGKTCKKCGKDNDISARKCECGAVLVDWNQKLNIVAGTLLIETDEYGWKKSHCEGAEVESVFIHGRTSYKVGFRVAGRKTPLYKWFTPNSPEWVAFRERLARPPLPEFISWRTPVGKKNPKVKIIWGQHDQK